MQNLARKLGYLFLAMALPAHAAVPRNYFAVVDQAVAQKLRDPDSRKVRIIRLVGDTVCGAVNARNGFGGYAGEQSFAGAFDAQGRITDMYIISDEEMYYAKHGDMVATDYGRGMADLVRICGF